MTNFDPGVPVNRPFKLSEAKYLMCPSISNDIISVAPGSILFWFERLMINMPLRTMINVIIGLFIVSFILDLACYDIFKL
jgi:hypothetical protein